MCSVCMCTASGWAVGLAGTLAVRLGDNTSLQSFKYCLKNKNKKKKISKSSLLVFLWINYLLPDAVVLFACDPTD